jgi:hypothetical protein
LPRLRDDATLVASIEKLVAKIEHPVAFAQSFDKSTGAYHGICRWGIGLGANIPTGLLVWRSALPEKPMDEKTVSGEAGTDKGKPREISGTAQQIKRRPKRFFGSITLDPDRAGLQVAKIAEEILFELTRADGSLKLTLEIDASSARGYPDDVVDVVRSNIRDLKINPGEAGFEDE